MSEIVDHISCFCLGIKSDTWQWFGSLSRDEWLVTLAACAACGFLFMMRSQGRTP